MFTRSMLLSSLIDARMLRPLQYFALPRNVAALSAVILLAGCQAPAPPPSRGTSEQGSTAATRAPSAQEAPAPTPPPAPTPAPEPEAPAATAEPTPPDADAVAAARLAQLAPENATLTAPERYTVVLETTRGDFHMDVRRSWAPLGADRFYNLVKLGFYEENAFFRVVDGFVAQTGLSGDPAVNRLWRTQRIADDPVTQSNLRGMVTFATSGKNSRTTQIFINLGNNANLDAMGFAPFGRIREMDKLPQIFSGYGEGAPGGRGPEQGRIQREGNAYLKSQFPQLDFIHRILVVDTKSAPATH
jgi:peptidyl-prolyl cis-trans isomerase A (cyclophilin A)